MYAKTGDWLIVEGRSVGGTVRHGLIEEVHGREGAPPYLVHWTDTGHRALTFPGPDAHVVTNDELRAQEVIAAAHFSSKHYRPSQRSTESAGA
ncbi:DUF1918 domain-containing protein [Nocardia sp. NBC_01730]|uniref:DUF1918 domain-containing protein n=1 Tax=Nocardia sp. NBC_01730 TaxID=2975998 RepID=UPI002E145EB2|nr:DUF1918 domain-containing protein [Nocardia sp. NBC_01730]